MYLMNKNKKCTELSRRGFLKSSATVTTIAAAPAMFVSKANAYVNAPKGSSVTLGFNVPLSGSFAHEGNDELRALKLAVKHLNGEGDGGLMNTMKPLSLKGNGILGKKVTFAEGNTQTNANAARAATKRLIEKDGATMICGGVSSSVAIAMQSLCDEAGVVFMAGQSHSNDTTGKDRRKHGFRHFCNADMSAAALGPVLKNELGNGRRAYHLTSDYNWGWSIEKSIMETTKSLDWEVAGSSRTPLGSSNFITGILDVMKSGADTLVLNQYGKDMVNAVTQAAQFRLRDKNVNGKDFQIVIPLFSRLMAQGVGEHIKGIYGTTNWHWSLQDAGTKAVVKSFTAEYGFPPSQAAHTCYVQTLLYANACELAGTFDPCGVIAALEGFKFDGMGNGAAEYRAEDHQCFKNVVVVKGNDNPTSEFDLMEVVEEVPRSVVEYPASKLGGSLGSCKNTA